MTREEAITYLNVIWNRYKAEYEIERETLDAYHMAIEALMHDIRTETHSVCLISKADAIGAVHEYYQKRFTEDGKWDADAKMLVLEDKTIAKDNMEICNIINALPSADAVSREVYDKRTQADEEIIDSYRQEFQKALSADAVQGEWIPCSERLPIPPTFCLVTTDGSHGDVIDIALYMSDGWHKASEVLAWMPLPTPYKGGAE